jgi:hypothetical protein
VVLGGDDSIPIPVLQAYADRGPVTVVQIDAHIDWRDDVQGERWGLSSTMRRSSEMSHIGDMIEVGRRGVGSARPADLAAAEARGVHFFSAHELHRGGVGQVLDCVPVGGSVFITVDVDGLDPSLVPGVIGPEPGGLTYFQVIDIIDGVAERGRIVGFDVVEFVPERDINGIGALTTFRLAAHAMGRISRQRASAAALRIGMRTFLHRASVSTDRPGPSAPTTNAHLSGASSVKMSVAVDDGVRPQISNPAASISPNAEDHDGHRTIGRRKSSPIETLTLRR